MEYKTIIISDLHLWTPDAQPQKLLKFLEKNPCKTLILNGDIIDTRYLKYFGAKWLPYTETLNKIIQIWKKNQTKILYLGGNHERCDNTIKTIWGDPQQEIIITSNKKRYIVCHGDSFEKWVSKPNIVSTSLFFIDTFFGRIDRNLATNYAISRFLKRIYDLLTNQKTRFINRAIAYAKKKKVNGIICSHIHEAKIEIIWWIHYLNSWDRTETCSALVEDGDGNREIVK